MVQCSMRCNHDDFDARPERSPYIKGPRHVSDVELHYRTSRLASSTCFCAFCVEGSSRSPVQEPAAQDSADCGRDSNADPVPEEHKRHRPLVTGDGIDERRRCAGGKTDGGFQPTVSRVGAIARMAQTPPARIGMARPMMSHGQAAPVAPMTSLRWASSGACTNCAPARAAMTRTVSAAVSAAIGACAPGRANRATATMPLAASRPVKANLAQNDGVASAAAKSGRGPHSARARAAETRMPPPRPVARRRPT